MPAATARQQHSPRLRVIKNSLSLAASGIVTSRGSAELKKRRRVSKWRRPQPERVPPIELDGEIYPGWYKPVWRAAPPRTKGHRKYVMSFHHLELILCQSRLRQAASWAVWRAIYFAEEGIFPYGDAKAISLSKLAAVTGFTESSVQQAITELLWRVMISVQPPEARGKPKRYGIPDPRFWRSPR